MKMEDLEDLEKSNEIKGIINASKVLYDKDKKKNPPRSFDSLMDQIAQREKPSANLRVSSWWLVAACTIGLLIGWTFPFTKSEVGEKLAVNDTVYVTHKQVDTVFQQTPTVANERVQRRTQSVAYRRHDQTPERVNRIQELPIPEIQKPMSASRGRNISQEQTPTHLYVCL